MTGLAQTFVMYFNAKWIPRPLNFLIFCRNINTMSESKPVFLSQTTITELMIPSYANFGGKIHGGILLSLMDKVAYACASKHAGTYCVTVSVDKVEFLQPVDVGELVAMHASVNYVGRTSLINFMFKSFLPDKRMPAA